MKLLVTGGCGFIGSNFIHHILKNNSEGVVRYPHLQVCNYDKLTYAGNLNNLSGIDTSRYTWVKEDICNYEAFLNTINEFKPDAVVAFGAESHVDRSLLDPQTFLRTNVLGTECILRAVKNSNIPRLLHVSTDEVYGSLLEPYEAQENSLFDPNSPYSVSKASGDMLCHAYYVTYKTPVVVVRGSNCYGKFQHPEKLIPRSITHLLQNKKIQIYGNGNHAREWIYVEDFCRGVETALFKGQLGEAYNLGGGSSNRVSNNIIAAELCKLLGKETSVEYIEDRKGHDARYALDSSKLKDLGWTPQYDLAKGLKATVDWYQANESWWRPLI